LPLTILSSEQKNTAPTLVTPQNQPKLDKFLASNKPEAQEPKEAENSKKLEDIAQNLDLVATAKNISQYISEVHQTNIDYTKILSTFIDNSNLLPEETRNSYFKSANEFSTELLKKIAEQKALVAASRAAGLGGDAPGILDLDKAIKWHGMQFGMIVVQNKEEIAKKQQKNALAKEAGTQELYIAAGSFIAFLFIVFLFIIIKIERNLRGIAVYREAN